MTLPHVCGSALLTFSQMHPTTLRWEWARCSGQGFAWLSHFETCVLWSTQDKDEELQTIYRRLSEASKERSDVRSALIGTQSELAETQAELDAWTHELNSFQQVQSRHVSASKLLCTPLEVLPHKVVAD